MGNKRKHRDLLQNFFSIDRYMGDRITMVEGL